MNRLFAIGAAASGLALLATLSLAAGAAGTPTAGVGASADTAQRGLYIALGDSISAGDGASSVNKSFVRLYYGYLESNGSGVTDLANEAQSGNTSTHMRTIQLPPAVSWINDASSDTKAVTIDIGSNDLNFDPNCLTANATGCPLAGNLRTSLAALNTALANDPGDETVQVMEYYNREIGTPLESERREQLLGSDGKVDCSGTGAALGLNDLIHCISIEQGAKPVDVLPIFDAAGPAFIAADHSHPNDAGHLAIAKAFGGAATPTAPPPPPPPPPAQCRVPRVIGRTLSSAKALLERSNCRAGGVKRLYSRKKQGMIIAQHPAAGAKLRTNAKVNLVVSKGQKPHRRAAA